MTVHQAGVLDISIIAALAVYDPAELPETFFITAITLGNCPAVPMRRFAQAAVSRASALLT